MSIPTMTRRPYPTFSGFEHVYLEDSFVLGLIEEPTCIAFDLNVILLPEHPLYHAPAPGEAFCFRAAELEFRNLLATSWTKREFRPTTDAAGKIDFGNIDFLFEEAPGLYHLGGDWGVVDVRSAPPTLRLKEDG